MKRLIVGAALAAVSVFASAELVNISAGGYQSGTQDVAACTVVDWGTTLVSDSVLLLALAEANGDNDPDLRAWSLDRNYVTTNNNWADGVDVVINGQGGHINLREIDPNAGLLYPTFLRAPRSPSDAAVFILAKRGERICVQSFDRSGTGKQNTVSLSVTDINAIAFKSGSLKSGQDLGARNLELVIRNISR